jgi:hypothetical protein
MPKNSRFALVNKNLCNYPLARDPRTRQCWWRSKPTGRWWRCDLPGGKRIRFELPNDVEERLRYCPTGFDINVLLWLLSEARLKGKKTVEFQSYAAFLELLGLGSSSRNVQRLQLSLRLWCAISIKFECWYFGKKKRGTRTLPPPIERLNQTRPLRITLHKEWTGLAPRYYSKVRLPLPHAAAAQNIVLALAASHRRLDDDDDEIMFGRKVRSLCDTVGLSHSTRTRGLRDALDGPVQDWYERQRKRLTWLIANGKIGFVVGKEAAQPERKPSPKAEPDEREAPKRSLPRVKLKRRQPQLDTFPKRTKEMAREVQTIGEDGNRYSMWRLPNGDYVEDHDLPDDLRPAEGRL